MTLLAECGRGKVPEKGGLSGSAFLSAFRISAFRIPRLKAFRV